MSTKSAIILIVVIIYLAHPADIVPDLIPLLGYIDDIAIAYLGIRSAFRNNAIA